MIYKGNIDHFKQGLVSAIQKYRKNLFRTSIDNGKDVTKTGNCGEEFEMLHHDEIARSRLAKYYNPRIGKARLWMGKWDKGDRKKNNGAVKGGKVWRKDTEEVRNWETLDIEARGMKDAGNAIFMANAMAAGLF
ncbi:hypothetical protein BZA77DRAFT_354726 [Pyronema omphalodes]|nr:hypothetical protein BZA77DRAFT_354726 [Pyronema omphalodes]